MPSEQGPEQFGQILVGLLDVHVHTVDFEPPLTMAKPPTAAIVHQLLLGVEMWSAS